MARSTRHTGPSITEAEAADPDLPVNLVPIRRPEIGFVDRSPVEEEEVEQSAGASSTPSTKKAAEPESKSKVSPRKAAPTTESHSRLTTEEDSDVDSTGTGGRRAKATRPARGPAKVRSTSDDDEFDEFE